MTFHKYLADSKMFEYDKHYRECQQQNKPFIKSKINPSHGNYTVNIDLWELTADISYSKAEGSNTFDRVRIDGDNGNFAFDSTSLASSAIEICSVSAECILVRLEI